MFVMKSTYDAMRRRAIHAQAALEHAVDKYNYLNSRWNKLVARINKLGGEQFLDEARIPDKQSEFTADDMQRLLMLCHPDKHDGKQMANDMTAKLVALKKKLESA